MDSQKSSPVLVIQSLGMGDILFALPVLKVLKRNDPDRPVIFLTHENHRELFQFVPEADEVITYKRKDPFALLQLMAGLRRRHFGLCLVLNPIFRGSLAALFSGAPVRVGYVQDYEKKQSMHGLERFLLTHAYRPREERLHETERYLDLLRMFGMEVRAGDEIPRLRNPSVKEAGTDRRPLVALNAGAGWALKRWPAERFAEVGRWLVQKYDARVVLTGGKAESGLNDQILKEMKVPGINLAGRSSLAESIQLLAGADLVITNDSGPVHISAALQVPTVALFGPGDTLKFKPLSSAVKVLYHSMPCSPCAFQYTSKCGNNLCLQEIRVEEVQEAVKGFLGGAGTSSPEAVALDEQKAVSRKKILYLQSTSEVGGTDITLLRTLRALDLKRFEPHVVLHKEGPFAKAYAECGAVVHLVPQMRKLTRRGGAAYLFKWIFGYFPAVLALRKIILKEKIDLVHTNTIHNLYGFLAARLAGVPHLWHIREIVIQSRLVRLVEVFLVEKFSDRFIVMDNAIAEAFLGKDHGFPKNVVKLYDGIDLERFHPGVSGARVRNELGLGSQVPLVGTVCRLDPWKGVDVFLEAARKILNENPGVRFLICGGEIEGHYGYENQLKEKARQLGILEKVYFTGWRYSGENLPEVYRALQVSVQTPVYPEPYGLVNLEAMASGVPVVAIRSGGPVELCAEGAVLVPPRDAESAARAVLELLGNPDRAQALGASGTRRVQTLFDVRKCTRALESIYTEILKGKA